MIKKLSICLAMITLMLMISGCSSSDEKDYSKVIDSALKANQELVKDYDWNFDENNIFERKKSNIMIWEDENNYYVYLRKDLDGTVYGDGYQIGKSNDKWDSSPDDRAKIKKFLDDKTEPIYEENNIELVSDNMSIR